jgi:hypothetical protein
MLRFRTASKKFSPALIKALSNGEPVINDYKLGRIFETFLHVEDSGGKPFPDNEQCFHDALVAMVDGRQKVPGVHRPN